ncbi:MAG: Thiamine-phosphate synthase [Planctomycetota bacterium]
MVHGKSSGFTPAAERTVQWCRQLFSAAPTADDRAALLVLALLHDESLASTCLNDLGVNTDWLRSGALGSAVADVLQSGLPQRLESEGSGCGPLRSLVLDEDPRDFQNILQRARELARREAADQLITSSLLLLAIPDQNLFIRERLTEQGGTLEVLRSRLLPEQVTVMERLAVEEPLEWSAETSATSHYTVGSGTTPPPDLGPMTAPGDNAAVSPVLRAVDACLNRAREGLRVLEDCARFVWNDSSLCAELKHLRHELARAEQGLRRHAINRSPLLQARNTPGDVGTGVTDPHERTRTSLQQLVLANSRRVQESLRSLEEFGKLLDSDFAAVMKQLRYRSYTAEQLLMTLSEATGIQLQLVNTDTSLSQHQDLLKQRRQRLQAAKIYVLITESLCRLPWLEVAEQALKGGADVLQLREKQLTDRELLKRARQLSLLCKKHHALFIINDRPDLAIAADADGVHVGQEELAVADIRGLHGWQGLIGVSTHSLHQLQQAFRDGADYAGVGPVFPSSTKAFDDFPGLAFVEQAAASAAGPWFAIGGITAERLPTLLAAGAGRIAVTAAITQSQNPTEAAETLKKFIQL